MKAFFGKSAIKRKFVNRVKKHMKLDHIRRNNYGRLDENGKLYACAVGCTLLPAKRVLKTEEISNVVNRYSLQCYSLQDLNDLKETKESIHHLYESELGIPKEIAVIEDKIFEYLDSSRRKKWPLRFLEAINVGADLSGVADEFWTKWSGCTKTNEQMLFYVFDIFSPGTTAKAANLLLRILRKTK